LAATLVCLLPGIEAQQTALTDAHLKSADLEIPKLVNVLGLKPGMAVADVGAGFGAWTMKLSKVVGPEGRVYANEIGTAQLGALRDSVQRDRLTNVTVVEGTATSVNLPAACCDAILIRDAYHHIAHPDAIVHSIAGALKPGGRLAVVDFPPRPHSAVPSDVPADRGGHGVLPEVVEREFGRVLVHVSTTLMWSPESQPASLYLVLFRKP
jgi:ubiquinone/menaquinone biosynthesis C-methylase UbiE